MLEYIFIIPFAMLLCYGAYVDYEWHIVEHWMWVELICLGLCFSFIFSNVIILVSMVFFTLVIWGLPVLFTMGLGDLMVLIGINMFFSSIEEIFMFALLFIFIWFCWTIIFKLWKKIEINRKTFFTYDYPLVPAIAISYIIWFGGIVFVR